MTESQGKAVLITGANTGIGKDLARQLALRDDYGLIYLACRDEGKARAAQADLARTTGRSIFEVIVMDTADLGSVTSGVTQIDRTLDALVMNAGGTGGATPIARTTHGVTEIFAANVLGHVLLLDQIIAQGLLPGVALMVGSEAARGVPKMRIPRPTFRESSVDEFSSVIDGSYFAERKLHPMLAYAQVKYLAARWMSAMARRHPDRRFVTMSPGNTLGTEALRDQPPLMRAIASKIVLPYIAPLFGAGHKLEVGTKRLVDGITDTGLVSGVFYASKPKVIVGPIIDQAEIIPDLRNEAIQDNAYAAIHRFI